MCVKLVPKVLIDGWKDRRVKMCRKLFDCVRDDVNFLESVIIGDE